MKRKELYLHLAETCERTAATTDLPETRAGMLNSAAVWRRLASASRPSDEAESNIGREKLAALKDYEARPFSAASISPVAAYKN